MTRQKRQHREHGHGRGTHRTRQWGGWGGTGFDWGENEESEWIPLDIACTANCRSSHICAANDQACLCSSNDSDRVLNCLQRSCSEDAAKSYQDEIASVCRSTRQEQQPATAPAPAPQAPTTKSPSAPSSSSSSASHNTGLITGQGRTPLQSPSIQQSTSPSSLTSAIASTNTSIASAAPASAYRTFLANSVDERNDTQTPEGLQRQEVSTSHTPLSEVVTSVSTTSLSTRSSPSATQTTSSRIVPSQMDPFGTGRDKVALPNEDGDLSVGAVAGIVIGVLAVLAGVAILAFLCIRKRRKVENESRPISPPTLAGGNAAHTTSWIDFGAARSSWADADEKAAPPIYNLYSNSRSPRMFSAFSGSHNSSDFLPSQPPPASLASRRTTLDNRRSKMWSRMTPKWIDVKRSSRPLDSLEYSSNTPSSFVLPASATPNVYHRSGGTSYFSRLLGHDRVMDRKRPVVSVKRIPSSESVGPLRVDGRAAQEQEELSVPVNVQPSMLLQSPSTSDMAEMHSTSPITMPSLLSRTSLPQDVPADESDADDMKAASTRAPSVDLAWVTQGMFEPNTPQVSTYKKVSIRRKASPSVSETSTKSKGRKSMPTISPTFSFRNSFHSSSVPSTPRTPRKNRETLRPPIPALPGTAGSAGFESPALPSSNNSVSGISRPTSTSTPTTSRSARVGRAL